MLIVEIIFQQVFALAKLKHEHRRYDEEEKKREKKFV